MNSDEEIRKRYMEGLEQELVKRTEERNRCRSALRECLRWLPYKDKRSELESMIKGALKWRR